MPIASWTGMLRLSHLLASIVISTAASACSWLPPMSLQGTPADLEILAGEWTGEYESAALGRRGSIEFRLTAGTNEARGGVVMTPHGQAVPYQPERYPEVQARQGDVFSSAVLTIQFVRASNGSVRGMLDRYWDPDRGCYAVTVFQGFIGERVTRGTFTTTFDSGVREASGTWWIEKKSARRSS